MNPPVSDEKTLDVLEYVQMLEQVARHCRSESGADHIRELQPDPFEVGMRRELGLVAEAIELTLENTPPPWSRIPDVRTALARLESEGASIEPRALVDLASSVRISGQILSWAIKAKEGRPLLREMLLSLSDLKPIADATARALDDDGNVRDSASPELGRVRKRIDVARDRIRKHFEGMLRSNSIREALTDSYVTVRDGRYVLPVRADRAKTVPGLVIDTSGSGQTLFIEPMKAVEENNKLRRLEAEERREVERILRELADSYRSRLPELRNNTAILAHFDSIMARSAYATDVAGVIPEVCDEPFMRIIGGRHPLLLQHYRALTAASGESREVVPLSLELNEKTRTVIITGPNTGGKTVALKTIGLLTLMAMAGIPVPAEAGTAFGAYGSVISDIGDAQSIEQDLSTFAAHLGRMIDAIESAKPESLVLLDEFGAGTDPAEGEALARALLEAFAEAGGHTVVTTHLGALKTFPESYSSAVNASLEFDSENLSPSYRFRVGLPGSSYALAIAGRLGLDPKITRRAEQLLGSRERDLERLISRLEQSLRAYKEKEDSIAEKESRYAELIRVLEDKRRRLDSHETNLRRKAEGEAASIVAHARAEVERVVRNIRETDASEETVRDAQHTLRRLKDDLESSHPEEDKRVADLGEIGEGDAVYVVSLHTDGEVVTTPDRSGKLRVRCGSATIVVHRSDLESARDKSPKQKRSETGSVNSSDEASFEIDVRGEYFEDAWPIVERFLDRAVLSGLETVRVIHGKGTGALRSKINAALAKDARVRSLSTPPMYEGGDGVTVVSLK